MTKRLLKIKLKTITACIALIFLCYWIVDRNTFTESGRIRALAAELRFVCRWVSIFEEENGKLPIVTSGDALASNRSFVRILDGRNLEQNPNGLRYENFRPDTKRFGAVYLGGVNKERDMWLDPWGEAYWINNLNNGLEIRSAGPDRVFYTSDDVVSIQPSNKP